MSIPTKPVAIDASELPTSSSPDLILVPATTLEYEQTWLLNGLEWKGPLTVPQYFDRERYLLKQELTKDGKITAWILTSKSLSHNLDGTRPILAACETILKSACVARNGKTEEVMVHGIGSVFTRPEHRGRGYAGRMMTELVQHLETFQQLDGNRGCFSVLFSDIGQTFYARYGWKAFPSTHIHLTPLDKAEYEHARERFYPVQDLSQETLRNLPAVAYLEEALKSISTENPNTPCVAIHPDIDHFGWHHAREEVQSQILELPFPEIKGAVEQSTGIAMIWCRVFATNPREWCLHILHIAIPHALRVSPTPGTENALSALLLRAQHEAYAWNMTAGVEVWDPSSITVSAAQQLRTVEQGRVEVIQRDKDHVCSLRWTGGRHGDDSTRDVIWVNNEKYGWC